MCGSVGCVCVRKVDVSFPDDWASVDPGTIVLLQRSRLSTKTAHKRCDVNFTTVVVVVCCCCCCSNEIVVYLIQRRLGATHKERSVHKTPAITIVHQDSPQEVRCQFHHGCCCCLLLLLLFKWDCCLLDPATIGCDTQGAQRSQNASDHDCPPRQPTRGAMSI